MTVTKKRFQNCDARPVAQFLLVTLVTLHFTPVSRWQAEFWTRASSRLASLFLYAWLKRKRWKRFKCEEEVMIPGLWRPPSRPIRPTSIIPRPETYTNCSTCLNIGVVTISVNSWSRYSHICNHFDCHKDTPKYGQEISTDQLIFFINFRIQIHLDVHLYLILYSSRSAPYLSSWSSSWGRCWRNDLSPRLDRARISAQCGLWCLLPSYNTAVIIFSIIQVFTNFSNPANRMADSSSATLSSSSVREQKSVSRKCPQSSNGAKEARCQRAPTKNSHRSEALPPKSPGGQEGPLTSGTCWWYLMMF